uniref:tRNA-intron lyase n=1 Tax=Angiostrongylus cantonensis TaxID=6313 RepID=A0A0K0D2J2_ANGCA
MEWSEIPSNYDFSIYPDIYEVNLEKLPVYDRLRLSPEETVYLSIDVNILEVFEKQKILTQSLRNLLLFAYTMTQKQFLRRYVVYRYLRRSGWCVRCGLPYGCDYYCCYFDNSSLFFISGVKIESHMEPCMFIGLNRVLTNMKKTLPGDESIRTMRRQTVGRDVLNMNQKSYSETVCGERFFSIFVCSLGRLLLVTQISPCRYTKCELFNVLRVSVFLGT